LGEVLRETGRWKWLMSKDLLVNPDISLFWPDIINETVAIFEGLGKSDPVSVDETMGAKCCETLREIRRWNWLMSNTLDTYID
jgi:hypothetical protein